MAPPRSNPAPVPRRKACDACSRSKLRCTHEHPSCMRCQQRGLACVYPRRESLNLGSNAFATTSTLATMPETSSYPTPNAGADTGIINDGIIEHGHPIEPSAESTLQSTPGSARGEAAFVSYRGFGASPVGTTVHGHPAHQSTPTHLHGESDLVCPIKASAIQTRWLNAFLPDSSQQAKNFPHGVATYSFRMLKAFAGAIIHGGNIPPFVHESQMTNGACVPLANCFSLLRICDSPSPGSERMTVDLLKVQINHMFDEHDSYDPATLLGAFQSSFIYILALYFHLNQQYSPFLRQAMIRLQQLAYATSSQGLAVSAELRHTRPSWESWIHVETKRRTLYTMYIFDTILCADDGLPTFIGTELRGLPASSSRPLWKATTMDEWNAAYNSHLAKWDRLALRIDELWPIPPEYSAAEIAHRRQRVDKWLEGVDEYGTFLYAITVCTHGG